MYLKYVLKVLKISILDVLQPKLNVPSKTSIKVILKITTVGSSKGRYNGQKSIFKTSS